MKHSMLFATILIASFQAANAADLSGSWHITGSVSDNPVDITCALTQKDTALSGSCTRKDGKSTDATGSVKDGIISWHYDTKFNGDSITITYNGKLLEDGSIAGTIAVDPYGAEGKFTATKTVATQPQ